MHWYIHELVNWYAKVNSQGLNCYRIPCIRKLISFFTLSTIHYDSSLNKYYKQKHLPPLEQGHLNTARKWQLMRVTESRRKVLTQKTTEMNFWQITHQNYCDTVLPRGGFVALHSSDGKMKTPFALYWLAFDLSEEMQMYHRSWKAPTKIR